MDVLLDGRNPPKNADLGMVYSWVYHIILYVYIYMYIYIYIAWFIQIYDDWVYRVMHIYIIIPKWCMLMVFQTHAGAGKTSHPACHGRPASPVAVLPAPRAWQ